MAQQCQTFSNFYVLNCIHTYPISWNNILGQPIFIIIINIFHGMIFLRYLHGWSNIGDHRSIGNICYVFSVGFNIVSGNYKLVNVITGSFRVIAVICMCLVIRSIQLRVCIIVIYQILQGKVNLSSQRQKYHPFKYYISIFFFKGLLINYVIFFFTIPDPYLPLCHLVSSFDILPPTPYQMT